MKNYIIKSLIIACAAIILFNSCNKHKVETPAPVEQELITTIKLLVTNSEGFNKTFTYKIENGFGSTSQGNIVKDSIILNTGKVYDVYVQLLNEKASPVADVTEEVINENTEHLFLYQSDPVSGNGSLTFSEGNKDNNGNPFNQQIKVSTGAAGNGSLTVTLKHDPTNKTALKPDDAGGETDAEAVFTVKLQ